MEGIVTSGMKGQLAVRELIGCLCRAGRTGAAVTTNLRLAAAPGNVRLRKSEGGVREPSVVDVSQLLTIDKGYLDRRLGSLGATRMREIDAGLRLVLSL